ncbi:MAG: hypothetical protein A2X64_11220 [Ignavibacteria bacterium GWF2_33_9]|nr:MAG: hypothetical protein A2X64_11220 [Ignavibacteria bacterium GWF2_33_9]
MARLGWPEILVIAFLILLLFGAKKIPELMKNLGSGMKEFKKSISGDESKDDGIIKKDNQANSNQINNN